MLTMFRRLLGRLKFWGEDDRYRDDELVYAQAARCLCGAGLAHPKNDDAWDCADILTGRAIPFGALGWRTHTPRIPSAACAIPEETDHLSTRPRGAGDRGG